MGYVYTMALYSAVKRKEMMKFTGKWMEPEIILSEVA